MGAFLEPCHRHRFSSVEAAGQQVLEPKHARDSRGRRFTSEPSALRVGASYSKTGLQAFRLL